MNAVVNAVVGREPLVLLQALSTLISSVSQNSALRSAVCDVVGVEFDPAALAQLDQFSGGTSQLLESFAAVLAVGDLAAAGMTAAIGAYNVFSLLPKYAHHGQYKILPAPIATPPVKPASPPPPPIANNAFLPGYSSPAPRVPAARLQPQRRWHQWDRRVGLVALDRQGRDGRRRILQRRPSGREGGRAGRRTRPDRPKIFLTRMSIFRAGTKSAPPDLGDNILDLDLPGNRFEQSTCADLAPLLRKFSARDRPFLANSILIDAGDSGEGAVVEVRSGFVPGVEFRAAYNDSTTKTAGDYQLLRYRAGTGWKKTGHTTEPSADGMQAGFTGKGTCVDKPYAGE